MSTDHADNSDKTAEPTGTPDAQGDPADLGESGKKAIAAEREARKVAEKSATEALSRLKVIEDANKSAEQKAADEAATAIRERDDARTEALRWRIAAKHGITDTDAETFLTGADEAAMTAQAERLAALSKQSDSGPAPGPRADLSQGAKGGATSKTPGDTFADFLTAQRG